MTVSDALNAGVLVSTENGIRTDNGVVAIRGFDPPVIVPPGTGKVLNLYVRQDRISVPPRGIIQFSMDSTPVFWGPVVTCPPSTSPGAGPFDQDRDALERVSVVGGEQLLRDSIVGPRLLDRLAMIAIGSIDVSAYALELCELYAHPALTVDESNFPATGTSIYIFYRPYGTLFDALERLTQLVTGGAEYWVDATGAIHFQAVT